METSKLPEQASTPTSQEEEDKKTLDLIQGIALNKYGLKLVPNDYSCQKCPSLEKEKCDLQQFIGELSQCVNLLQDPRMAPNPDLMSSVEFQQKLKTHLQNIMSEYNHLQQFLRKPLNLADLVKSPTEDPSTSANLTPTPAESQSTGERTRKHIDSQQGGKEESVRRPVFQRTLQFTDLGTFKVNFYNMSHNDAKGQYFPDSSVLSIVGRSKPEEVWDYISKMKAMKGDEVVTFLLTPVTSQDVRVYKNFFTSLKERERFGVMESQFRNVYLIPLGKGEAVPGYLQPFNGEGLRKDRDFLLAVTTRCFEGKGSKLGKHS